MAQANKVHSAQKSRLKEKKFFLRFLFQTLNWLQ